MTTGRQWKVLFSFAPQRIAALMADADGEYLGVVQHTHEPEKGEFVAIKANGERKYFLFLEDAKKWAEDNF